MTEPTHDKHCELLPCPFCGGEAEFEREGTSRRSCIVRCRNCGARHESSDEGKRSGRSWNTLAAPPSQGTTSNAEEEILSVARKWAAKKLAIEEFVRLSVLGRGDVPMDVRQSAEKLLADAPSSIEPIQAHSKTQFKRIQAQGANVVPPSSIGAREREAEELIRWALKDLEDFRIADKGRVGEPTFHERMRAYLAGAAPVSAIEPRVAAALHACEGLDTSDLAGNEKGWLASVVHGAALVESRLNTALRACCAGNTDDNEPVRCQSYEASEQDKPCPRGRCVMAERTPSAIEPTHPNGLWMVYYEDPQKKPDIFFGPGAKVAAMAKYASAYDHWSCHLLSRIPDKCVRSADGGTNTPIADDFDSLAR